MRLNRLFRKIDVENRAQATIRALAILGEIILEQPAGISPWAGPTA
jgi:hypothetical protein